MATEFVYMDGKYVDATNASIPVRTHAFLYGTSVFEGIRAYYNKENGQLYTFRMKEHFERLLNSCKIMHMNPMHSVEELCEIAKDLLRKNNYKTDAYLRPQVYKTGQKLSPELIDNPDALLMFSYAMGDYVEPEKGLNVCVSSWKRNDDNAIPSRAKVTGSYANMALIVSDARLAGFDDAIVLDNAGKVTEGSIMNIFLVEGDTIVTPQTTDNILVGITRNTIIELAKDVLGLKVCEREISRSELYTADEAFYCGTGAQVSSIVSIDNRPLGKGEIGDVTKELQKLYFDVVKGKVEKYKKWCTPIYE